MKRTLRFFFESNLLRRMSEAERQWAARIAHYLTMRYHCSWHWQDDGLGMSRWHPLVESPIPYPMSVAEVPSDVFSVGLGAQAESPFTTFVPLDVSSDWQTVAKQVEKSLEPELTTFRRNREAFQQDYDLFFDPRSIFPWEEIFHKRTEADVLQAQDIARYGDFGWYRSLEYSWALGHLRFEEGTKTLDVGSLDTFVPSYLSSKGLDVVSIDIDEEAVAKQQQICAGQGSLYTARVGDICSTPFADASFDQVVLISTIEHIEDPGDILAMQEVFRILRKGGLVVITTPYDHHWYHEDGGVRPSGYLQRFYSMQSLLVRLVQPPLFEIVDIEFIGGSYISPGNYTVGYVNPTKAAVACLCLRKRY